MVRHPSEYELACGLQDSVVLVHAGQLESDRTTSVTASVHFKDNQYANTAPLPISIA